jgi:hypothetical protein
MGYQPGYSGTAVSTVTPGASENVQTLKQQRDLLESQLVALQESLAKIEKRLQDLERQ